MRKWMWKSRIHLPPVKTVVATIVLAAVLILCSSNRPLKPPELVGAKFTTLRFIYIEARFNGLGAQTLRIIDAFALASRLNASFCIAESRYWNYGCAPHRGWSCYFKPLHSSMTNKACNVQDYCRELSDIDVLQLTKYRCVIVSSRRSYTYAARVLRSQSGSGLKQYRHLAAEVWQLNDQTQKAVQRVVEQMNLPRQYVALHIRRGDKAKERPYVPLQRYTQAAKLFQSSNGTVFIATDDGAVLKTMHEQLVGKRVVSVAAARERKGHNQKLMNRMYMKRNSARVVTLLAEIEMMRTATVFIGTFSSNLGRLVHVLREQEAESSVSLDDKWAPGVAFRTFGQHYCGSKQANQLYCSRMQEGDYDSSSGA